MAKGGHSDNDSTAVPRPTNSPPTPDKDTYKDRNKVLPRPIVCYIYQKQGVQEFECDIGCLLVTKTQFYALVELNIFSGVNIF